MTSILENLAIIKQRISTACIKAGRDDATVKLLLATKTVPTEKIMAAFASGETLIGENKVQELKEKYEALKQFPHTTHFIGHLQTNKINDVIRYVSCIQSLDRPELAIKLQKRLESEDRVIDCYIQVNTSFEESKFGIAPNDAMRFATQLKSLDRIQVKGLMTIGLFSSEPQKVAACYRLLKQLQIQLRDKDIPVPDLSMGMSNDLEIAIEEGATMIRAGTAIFGQRVYPDSYYWNEQNSG